ncbi:hypothetical protein BH11MYX4_BH11MYX4_36600 [soil metagenome]
MSRADELMRESTPRGAIVTVMAAEFSAAPRTVDDYLARVRHRWGADNASVAKDHRERAVDRLERLAEKLEDRAAWSALVNVERLLVDLRGLRVQAHVVEVHEKPEPDVSPDEAVGAVTFALEAIARVIQLQPAAASDEAVRALRAALTSAARSLDANVTKRRGTASPPASPDEEGQESRHPGDAHDDGEHQDHEAGISARSNAGSRQVVRQLGRG